MIAIGVASLALSYWLTGAQIENANWGIIDDHDTLTFIGMGNHHLPLDQYFHVLVTKTELGTMGHYLRFRPFYYLTMLIESIVWGDNVHLWYACRVVLFAIFIATTWIAIACYLGIVVGFGVVFFAVSASFWGDVFGRLGPGEIYGSAGLGLWILGIAGLFTSSRDRLRNLSMLSMTLGTIMMVGSKETMFPFVGYSLCAFALFIYLHRDSLSAKIHFVVMLLYGALTTTVIALALSRAGEDFIGHSVGLTGRLHQLVGPLGESTVKFLLPALLWVGLTAVLVRLSGSDTRSFWKLTAAYLAGVVGLWSFYLSQYVAYSGEWPTNMRYDFPGVFALPALVVISVIFAAAALRQVYSFNAAIKGAGILAALAVAIYTATTIPFPVVAAVASNIERTSAFQKTLNDLATLAKKNPQEPIILRANGPWAYEKIISSAIYLRWYEVTNPMAVKLYPDNNPDPKLLGLGAAIKQWEENGRQYLVPLNSIADAAKSGCLSLGLNGPAEPGCAGGYEL